MWCERATNLSTPFRIESDFESVQLDNLVIIKKNVSHQSPALSKGEEGSVEFDRTPTTKQSQFFPLGSMFLHMYPVIGHPDSLWLTSGLYPCPYDLDSEKMMSG